jgi:hypothetical protein
VPAISNMQATVAIQMRIGMTDPFALEVFMDPNFRAKELVPSELFPQRAAAMMQPLPAFLRAILSGCLTLSEPNTRRRVIIFD